MMRYLLGWIAMAIVMIGFQGGVAQAQEKGQLSVATKFVSGFCLEATAAGDGIYIKKCDASAYQALAINDDNGQIHQATKCLAIVEKGQPLALKDCADVADQKWTFNDDGTLKSDSGLCADILNFQKESGASVIAWDCNATDNQKFFATNIKIAAGAAAAPSAPAKVASISGKPVIASYFVQGLCLQSSSSHGIITIEACNQKAAQSFHFASGASGTILQGDLCLGSVDKGGELVVSACNHSASQNWRFTPEGALRNAADLCADIFKFGTSRGTTVIAWDCTGTDNQKWYPAVAATSGTFSMGHALAANLRSGGKVTTVSISANYSGYNLTGAGGAGVSADEKDQITGGENNIIVLGGAGLLTSRFAKGLAAPEIAKTIGASLLPKDWSFFSGATAGTMPQ